MICMKAVCFIKRRAISACYVSFFLIFLLKVFARDPSWQQDCRGVEQLPAKIPDVPFNPGQIQIGKKNRKFQIGNKIKVKFKLAKSSLRFGTRSLHGPWLTPDNNWDCSTYERKFGPFVKFLFGTLCITII